MQRFRSLILTFAIFSFSAQVVGATEQTAAAKANAKTTKAEQKQVVKQDAKSCPEGQAYCCTGQDAEGFDKCGCFTANECAEANNN